MCDNHAERVAINRTPVRRVGIVTNERLQRVFSCCGVLDVGCCLDHKAVRCGAKRDTIQRVGVAARIVHHARGYDDKLDILFLRVK